MDSVWPTDLEAFLVEMGRRAWWREPRLAEDRTIYGRGVRRLALEVEPGWLAEERADLEERLERGWAFQGRTPDVAEAGIKRFRELVARYEVLADIANHQSWRLARGWSLQPREPDPEPALPEIPSSPVVELSQATFDLGLGGRR